MVKDHFTTRGCVYLAGLKHQNALISSGNRFKYFGLHRRRDKRNGAFGILVLHTMELAKRRKVRQHPAHLQLHAGKKLTPEQRDAIRAEIIRTRLQSLDPPVMSEKQAEEEWEEPPDNIVDL